MLRTVLKTMVCLSVTAIIGLTGCAEGGNLPQQAVKNAPTDLVVIGNSITRSNPVPALDWQGAWGMAASAADKDFAHLVAATMHLPLTSAVSFSTLEIAPAAAEGTIPAMAAPVKSTSMVIIQLSDNVQPAVLSDFAPRYGMLLDAVKKARILVCISSWGKADSYDTLIKEACAARGGRYVFIGDIRTDPSNLDSQGVQFSNAAVNVHPHDWSMARIAERIVAAALSN